MRKKLTRLDMFLFLFKWAFIKHWDNFKTGVKTSWKESWIDSKALFDFHNKKVEKPKFESEHEIYQD